MEFAPSNDVNSDTTVIRGAFFQVLMKSSSSRHHPPFIQTILPIQIPYLFDVGGVIIAILYGYSLWHV